MVLATPAAARRGLRPWPACRSLHSLLATLGVTTKSRERRSARATERVPFWGEGYNTSYEKYAIWAAEEYDALLYLDTDLAVLKNLDHVIRDLLAMPEMNAHALTPDGCGGNVRHAFNTGVWGVRPNCDALPHARQLPRGTRIPCQLGEQTASMAFFRVSASRATKRRAMGVGEQVH